MKSLKALTFAVILAVLAISSCDVDSENRDMLEFVNSKGHDERLLGWWMNKSDSSFVQFRMEDFKLYRANFGMDGKLIKYKTSSLYWCTEGDKLYVFHKGSFKIGLTSNTFTYTPSDDLMSIQYIDDYGGTYIGHKIDISEYED